jgi:hypothetical protein
MEIDWLEDANRRGLFPQLTKHEQNEYLDTLFHISKSGLNPKVSEKALDVYGQLRMQGGNGNSKGQGGFN